MKKILDKPSFIFMGFQLHFHKSCAMILLREKKCHLILSFVVTLLYYDIYNL